MRNSPNHLPQSKQDELERIVNIIQGIESRVEIIILFGSFARGQQVDDRYVEDNIVYSYKSDFDLLLVVENRELADDFVILDDIKETIRNNKEIQTPISVILEDIEFLNEQLEIGRYFYTDIMKEGIILYDSKKLSLSKPRKLTSTEQVKIATEDYELWIKKAGGFFNSYVFNLEKEENNLAAFLLHQTAEALYNTILLVFSGYKPKEHDLEKLEKEAKRYVKQVVHVFPRKTRTDKELFDLLNSAYIDARYRKDYEITRTELKLLANRIKKFKKLVEKSCKKKIGE